MNNKCNYYKPPREPKTIGYDWKGKEIFEYDTYFITDKQYKVLDDTDDIIPYILKHDKEALFELLWDNYDIAWTLSEIASEFSVYWRKIEPD